MTVITSPLKVQRVDLIDLKGDDLIVSRETAIKADLDINVNPELISVLKIEPQGPTGDPKVNVDTNPVF